jgi:hypothetical protein
MTTRNRNRAILIRAQEHDRAGIQVFSPVRPTSLQFVFLDICRSIV